MQGESQSSTSFSTPSGNGAFGGASGTGSGSGSGGTLINFPTEVITANDLANQTVPPDPVNTTATLSEQIAANFAALSTLMGNEQAGPMGGGSYSVPVPVPAKTSSPLIWVIMIGAALAIWYFAFHKKEE